MIEIRMTGSSRAQHKKRCQISLIEQSVIGSYKQDAAVLAYRTVTQPQPALSFLLSVALIEIAATATFNVDP